MVETSTQTDLIRLLYSETSIDECTEISHHLTEDDELISLNKDLHAVKDHLNTVVYHAQPHTLTNILNYAKHK